MLRLRQLAPPPRRLLRHAGSAAASSIRTLHSTPPACRPAGLSGTPASASPWVGWPRVASLPYGLSAQARPLHTSPPSRAPLTPFMLADIGEGVTECEVIQWFVKEGDPVEEFGKICEVQSDKATVEITSRFEGTIRKLYYQVGDMAQVGKPLVDIEVASGGVAPVAAAAPEPSWTAAASSASASSAPSAPSATTNPDVLATPGVRRLAREMGIDLALVTPTGRGQRITKEDLHHYTGSGPSAASAAPSALSTPTPTPTTPMPGSAPVPEPTTVPDTTDVPLTAFQKAMFKSMTRSLQIPHFGYSDEINIDAVLAFRAEINRLLASARENHDPALATYADLKKITVMPIFLKAMSLALKPFPLLNAQLVTPAGGTGEADAAGASLRFRRAHHIGVAMDTPVGLIVPNVKHCEQKSLLEIALELERLKRLAKQGALSRSDLADGTITLSNIGAIGGTVLHPVLVESTLCIGALGQAQTLPRYHPIVPGKKELELRPTQVMQVSFNADHRVVDGATVARFVQLWKRYLEHPSLLSVTTV
ncbi:hypothetical protein CXG81DRAFT_14379 [Caulochytrium protostelioides]|uniref:Dihydrolipoamide acetyltransferase component of pyruvate dehydrogenase complex n=1 Tax=Caulochytrium protostelioides TaxID=1555241 RepID=A0A4P9X3B9_9FUNG|nr:hypothetical protein CXG81DRAFT_14379 [Caulochytrium protostelioides]|eukprot:RKO99516.1 hypothetical protein CXG81DRAFT_14379 [Caulochytrium protostelioides]